MANFKGGFAFNNGPAKVEVEQAPDGTLISCVNPVTGESLAGANYSEAFEGTAANLGINGIDPSDLESELRDGNCSMRIYFDTTAIGWTSFYCDIFADETSSALHGFSHPSVSVAGSVTARYCNPAARNVGGSVEWFCDMFNIASGVVTDGSSYGSLIPTRTIISYHPMPE